MTVRTDDNFAHRVFTIDEAAEYLRISRVHLYKLIRDRKIRRAKLGNRSLIIGAEIARILEAGAR